MPTAIHRYETALRYCREHPEAPPDAAVAPRAGVCDQRRGRGGGDSAHPPPDSRRAPAECGCTADRFQPRLSNPTVPSGSDGRVLCRPGGRSAADSERRIGCALAGAEHYWLLSFDERIHRGSNRSAALRAVDVTVLHDVLFQRVLGFTPEQQEATVSYTSSAQEALQAVAERRCQAAFFLNPTPYDQVQQVCGGGETMPPQIHLLLPQTPDRLGVLQPGGRRWWGIGGGIVIGKAGAG